MRRFMIAVSSLALLSTTLRTETVYTRRTNNPLREGAGAYYSLIVSVPENTALEVKERSGNWVMVRLPDKRTAWIAASCLADKKSDRMAVKSLAAVWSSPKASKAGISAAIKGFAEKYGKTDPGNVDLVLKYTEKNFTAAELASFSEEVRGCPSNNRGRLRIEDLDLANPEYYPTLPEQQIGTGIAARIIHRGVVDNKPLHRYVNMICAAITADAHIYDWDITVIVLTDRTVNAFSVPGGYIFVTLGSILECKDEAELAGMIAHEIAHLYRRHGLQEMSKRIAMIRLDEAFAELEAEVGDATEDEKEMEDLVDHTYEKIVHPRLLSYELEADKIGAILAAHAGYDPFGLVRVSDRIARIPKEQPDIFDFNYMLPDDAVERATTISAFAEENFKADVPGARMVERFRLSTSATR